ncbi:MAG: hypothetical protein ILP14_05445 [Oscillospiraceae bacterium]|nr:hypothetical protein [Oscillospiraceae bacterium]
MKLEAETFRAFFFFEKEFNQRERLKTKPRRGLFPTGIVVSLTQVFYGLLLTETV